MDKEITGVTKRVTKIELENTKLLDENVALKERLLEIEFNQKKNNLVFEGIKEEEGENDRQCYNKIMESIANNRDIDTTKIWVNKCYRLGKKRKNQTRPQPILCTFDSEEDIKLILQGRKHLPKGIYVNEDLPEDWDDRRQVLKPIFTLAKKDKKVQKVSWKKDKLVIDGKEYTAAPVSNLSELVDQFDLPATCEKKK